MKAKIASAQYPISKHQSLVAWRNHTENWVKKAIDSNADLLVFPEYGSMELVSLLSEEIQLDIHLQIAEMQGLISEFKSTFSDLAIKYNTIIIAPSFPVLESEKYYNRAFVFGPKGLVGYQDKFFMTRFENEEWRISSAPKKLTVFETHWGSFGIQICYDSEFHLGTHQLANNGIDLLLVPSCTETIRGATRVHVGTRARAMEQQIYAVVAQTVGNADWSPAVDINYGYSGFYSTPDKNFPEEGIIGLGIPQEEKWFFEELDFNLIKTVREDGQVFNYKDHSQLISDYKHEEIFVEYIKID